VHTVTGTGYLNRIAAQVVLDGRPLGLGESKILRLASQDKHGWDLDRQRPAGSKRHFPSPAPNRNTTFPGFDGTNPNGTWRFYGVDGTNADVGKFASRWSLGIRAKASKKT
jgi:hypothetical protein